MMRSLIALSAVVLFLVCPRAAVYAQSYGGDTIFGEIQSIDRDSWEMTVKKYEGVSQELFQIVKVAVIPETRITKDGEQIKPQGLETGDNVRISCEITVDGCKALTVAVEEPETVR
jgi:hypothetical protein